MDPEMPNNSIAQYMCASASPATARRICLKRGSVRTLEAYLCCPQPKMSKSLRAGHKPANSHPRLRNNAGKAKTFEPLLTVEITIEPGRRCNLDGNLELKHMQ
eukprot:4774301-Pleurochrysis_carterae.AAC.2